MELVAFHPLKPN